MIPANIGFQYIYRIKVQVIEHPSYVGQIRNKFGMTVIFVDIHRNSTWKWGFENISPLTSMGTESIDFTAHDRN